MTSTSTKENNFILFCLKKYFGKNIAGYIQATGELQNWNKNRDEFLHDFLLKRNLSTDELNIKIEKWKKEFGIKNRRGEYKSFLKRAAPFIFLLLFAIFFWKLFLIRPIPAVQIESDKLFVITTSGFCAHDLPSLRSPCKEKLEYGDTVTDMRDTINGMLRVSKNNRILYGPAKYFITEKLFHRYDSLFEGFRFNQRLEKVNSKIMFCVYDFIHSIIHSNTIEWEIPLHPWMARQLSYGELSIPGNLAAVKIKDEGALERFHVVLVARRGRKMHDSVNYHLLLLELLPEGEVIRKLDFPLSIVESPCFIAVKNLDRFRRGVINGNVYLQAAGRKNIVNITWDASQSEPVFSWSQ
jgi:hypothetical protein